jgi:hypothetical protein
MNFSFSDYAIYQSHCLRCDALLDEFHNGKIPEPEFVEMARRLGFSAGEIRTEIEMHMR